MKNDPLLEKVHKNARTGLFTVPKVRGMASDRRFRQELSIQETEYRNLYSAAEELNGGQAAQIGSFAKLRTSMMIRLSGDDTSKLAQMMLLGSTMGIVDVTRALKQHPEAPKASKALAEDFLAAQERNVEVLKQYL